MILTGGEAISGILFDKKHPTFFILIEKFNPFPHSLYKKGAKLITYEYERTFPTIKTINYTVAVALQEKRIKEKAVEILFVSKGTVSEASTSNICIVNKNTVITPKEDVLAGTTLNFSLSLAHPLYLVERRGVTVKELFSADEVFITATNKEIVPIVNIDGKKIGNGKPGPVTRHLINIFREQSGSDVMPRL
jgi:D-alanine transaminase/branched-chain amino acid aminotransferase